MSLKSIELQVAIPRTLDTAKLQEQQQQKEHTIFENTNAVQKDAELKRSQVNKNEKSAESTLRNDIKEKKQHPNKERQQKELVQKVEMLEHPYKGTIIDYTG